MEPTNDAAERPAPGGVPVTDDNDEWFCSLPAERKASIRRWLDRSARGPEEPDPLQMTIEDVLT
jgi:hypothetical protein